MTDEERSVLEEVQSMAEYIEETRCMSYEEARLWILRVLAKVFDEGAQEMQANMFDDPTGDLGVDNPYRRQNV